MPLIDIFNDRPKERQSTLPDLTPEQQDSILRSLSGKVLGGASYIGGVLDKTFGGRAIRGLFGGKPEELLSLIPGSDTLGITDPENAVSGRELVSGSRENQPGIMDDLAGFAAEVALDPATYLTLGGSALSKAGKFMKKAGVIDDAAKVATAAKVASTGDKAATVGKRVARMTVTPEDLLKANPQARTAAELAAGGAQKLADVSNDPVGGLFGLGFPFMDPLVTFGHGETAQKIAGVLDKAGEAVRWSAPGRYANYLFNPEAGNRITRAGQESAAELRKLQAAGRADVLGQAAQIKQRLDALGVPNDTLVRVLDRMVEEPGGVVNAAAGKFSQGVANELAGLPQQTQNELLDIVSTMQKQTGDWRQQALDLGHHVPELVDAQLNQYHPRFAQAAGGPSSARGSTLFDQGFPPKREDILKNIPEGRSTIEAMATDPLLTKGTTETPLSRAARIRNEFGVGDQKQAEGLAEYFGNREAKRFYNDPITDFIKYGLKANKSNKASEELLNFIGKHAVPHGDGVVPLQDVLEKTKFVLPGGTAPNPEALAQLAKRGIGDIRNVGLPQDIAEELARSVQTASDPGMLGKLKNAFDSELNFEKALWTTPWPGFQARNRVTGLWMQHVMGAYHPGTNRSVAQWILGKSPVLSGAENYPAVKQILLDRGIPNTPENATKIAQELAFKYELKQPYHGQGAAADTPDILGDFNKALPGKEPNTSILGAIRDAIPKSKAEANPRNIRGVMNYKTGELRPETTFAPVRAGEKVGQRVEDLNRLQPFYELLRQGYDPAVAAAKVKAANVDYSSRAFTAFEKQYMTRLVPFYKFTSRMVPYTLKELAEKPGGKVAQAIRFGNSQRDENGFTPDYIGNSLSIHLGEPQPGTKRFLTGFGLPHETLNSLVTIGPGGLQKTIMDAFAQGHPAAKIIGELGTGKQFYTGRDLKDLDARSGRIAEQTGLLASPKSVPYWLDEILMNSPAARAVSTAGQLADTRKGIGQKAVNILTGVRTTDVDMEKQREIAARNILTEMLRGRPGVGHHESLYVSPENAATMDKDTLELMALLQSIQKQGAKRRKEKNVQRTAS